MRIGVRGVVLILCALCFPIVLLAPVLPDTSLFLPPPFCPLYTQIEVERTVQFYGRGLSDRPRNGQLMG